MENTFFTLESRIFYVDVSWLISINRQNFSRDTVGYSSSNSANLVDEHKPTRNKEKLIYLYVGVMTKQGAYLPTMTHPVNFHTKGLENLYLFFMEAIAKDHLDDSNIYYHIG